MTAITYEYYRDPKSKQAMPISTAVLSGHVKKSATAGCLVIRHNVLTADEAVSSGLLDEAAVRYVLALEAVYPPSFPTRVDA